MLLDYSILQLAEDFEKRRLDRTPSTASMDAPQNDYPGQPMEVDFGSSVFSFSPSEHWETPQSDNTINSSNEYFSPMNFENLNINDQCADDQSDRGMISNCTTCPGFGFCENTHKLGGFPSFDSRPSIMIKYDSDDESNKPVELEIHQSKSRTPQSPQSPQEWTKLVPIAQSIGDHPLESWKDQNAYRLPMYGTKSNNIFMQMQDEPLSGSTLEAEQEDEQLFQQNPLLFLSLPPPDDLPVDDNMAYFLGNRMDAFLGFGECFSSAYKSLYLLSANNRVLRHVLFAFVNYLNDNDRKMQSALCTMHLRKAIPTLQNSLTYLNFDEGHILAIPLLAYLAFWFRNFDMSKAHLRGFYRMLIHANYLDQDRFGKVSPSDKMSSTLTLMWRLAVRLDHYFGFMRPEEESMPPIKPNPESSRRYITDFIDPSASEWTDCLVLTDELEDLRNLAVHYNRRTTIVRASDAYTPQDATRYIQNAGQKVVVKIDQLEGNILRAAQKYNAVFQPVFLPMWYGTMEPFPANQFLHYSPLFKSLHHRFIEIILMNRTTLIHATITSHPKAGPDPPERLQAAIEICCAFATFKERMGPFALKGRGKLLEALMFAGYTFATPKHILEYQWIQKRLNEEADFGHSGAGRMSQLLEMSFQNPDATCWEYAKIAFPR